MSANTVAQKLLLRILALFVGLSILFAPAAVFADTWNPFGGVTCDKTTASSAVCATKAKSITGSNGVIVTIANFVALIAGIAAVIILLIASIKYITAGGDQKEVESAKNTIIYTVVGIIVILLAKVLITFIVSKVG